MFGTFLKIFLVIYFYAAFCIPVGYMMWVVYGMVKKHVVSSE